jgi:hypothetical protein
MAVSNHGGKCRVSFERQMRDFFVFSEKSAMGSNSRRGMFGNASMPSCGPLSSRKCRRHCPDRRKRLRLERSRVCMAALRAAMRTG